MIRPRLLYLATALLLATGCPNDPTPSSTTGDDTDTTTAVTGFGTGDDAGATPTPDVQSSDTATPDASAPPDTNTTEDTGPAQPDTPEVQAPKIQVDPPEYTFSYLSPLPALLTRQFTIFNGGNAALTVTGVSLKAGSSADFGIIGIPPLPKTLNPGKHSFTIVSFSENEGGTGTLLVESTDPATPVLEVPLSSHLKGSNGPKEPCAAIKPSALNFGTVVRGETKTLSAELVNCGKDTDLTLTKITRSNFLFIELSQEMQVDPEPPMPLTLPPGGTLPINVTYAPLLAGPDIGYFLFHTDDPNEPTLQLDVSGLGVAPPIEELGLTIKVSWDADLCDIDSHLIEPGGSFFDCDTDCHFGNPAPDWGVKGDWKDDPFLDVDDIDGYGPEHTNISEPQPGTYKFVIHYYKDSFDFGDSTSTSTTVEVFNFGNKIAEFGPQFLDSTNWNWDVFEIEWPSKNITPLGNTYQVPSSAVKTCLPWP